jgi:UDP-N-acetylglucosamine transferase subunit ALG13
MIFVTVGTHEQSFDRLICKVDEMVGKGNITEEVFIQTGYTKYKPVNCGYRSMIGNDLMQEYSKNARIIITHGRPGSIMNFFTYGKIPVVVPRQHDFNEHVDNHQMRFTERLEKQKKVLAVYDIEKLPEVLSSYEKLISTMSKDFNSNTLRFVATFEKICMDLLK